VGASSAAEEHWDQINWKQCERQVSRLQAPVVEASREDRWGNVRCLQRLLTCSFSNKTLVVKRVTENKVKEPRAQTMYFGLRGSPNSKRSRRDSVEDITPSRYGGYIFRNPAKS
jgi:hypothetical protein